jgi:tetratricopeptide (TPR) repeat protein
MARLAAAIALANMEKRSLAEYELRQLLRHDKDLDEDLIARALIQLCSVHQSLGDSLLAENEARRALSIAEKTGREELLAHAHQHLGRIYADRGDTDPALVHTHEALARFRAISSIDDALRAKVTLGPLYARRDQFREGVRLLKEVQEEARALGRRYILALASAWLGELYFRHGDSEQARRRIRESSALASSGGAQYVDILFVNAFYQWQIAQREKNAAEARLALGRLKYLRPQLEHDNLQEVRDFDRFVEKGGAQ